MSALKLDDLVDLEINGVDEYIALNDSKLRENLANRLTRLFVGSNTVVLVLIIVLFVSDLCRGTDIIDTKVVMTLIGATTVQLGTMMVSMSAYLFPKPK